MQSAQPTRAVSMSCHVMSLVSCRVESIGIGREDENRAEQSRTEQYGCARYSQLIRIIECQACGTEGTEWRRRGPLSLCVRPLSGNAWVFRSLCVSDPVIVSVSASVFLHVLIVTRDGCSSTGHGRAGRLCGGSRELQLVAGCRAMDAGPEHNCATLPPVPGPLCRERLVEGPQAKAEGIGGGTSRDSRLGAAAWSSSPASSSLALRPRAL